LTTQFDVIVIGGGLAGLTAGLTAARLGRSTLVLTGDALGGHLITIENVEGYPGYPDGVPGYDLCPIAQEQAAAAGAGLEMAAASAIARDGQAWVIEGGGARRARAVIVATGTSLQSLGVPGEAKLRGKGVSQCASCDAPLLRKQKVVVAGGGDSALQEALTLAEHADEVAVVHHGDAPIAQASFRARVAANRRIVLRPNTEITEILGDEVVAGVRVRDTRSGAPAEIEAAGVFVFVGLRPNGALVAELSSLDQSGHIVTDSQLRASRPGLFAAGTVRAGAAGRAAAAAGDGALAAITADAYLRTSSTST
jgi:thioredoxin reductase (NADPH)